MLLRPFASLNPDASRGPLVHELRSGHQDCDANSSNGKTSSTAAVERRYTTSPLSDYSFHKGDAFDAALSRYVRRDGRVFTAAVQLQRFLVHRVMKPSRDPCHPLARGLMQRLRLAMQFFVMNDNGNMEQEDPGDGKVKVLLYGGGRTGRPLPVTFYSPISVFHTIIRGASARSPNLREALCALVRDADMRPSPSSGKSQSILAFSSDRRLLIKSISREEAKTFRSMMDGYAAHMHDNPNTLLPRFYCLMGISLTRQHQLYICLSHNVFDNVHPDRPLHSVYDIKGSQKDRSATMAEAKKGHWKDNDLRAQKLSAKAEKHKEKLIAEGGVGGLQAHATLRVKLLSQLQRDVNFLLEHDIMDYSFLIGKTSSQPSISAAAASSSSGEDEENNHPSSSLCVIRSDSGDYHLGLIDVLQVWNNKKRAAMVWKSLTNTRTGLSTVPPATYARRIMRFLRDEVV